MNWASPIEESINALLFPENPFNMTKEYALQILRMSSNEDFGEDVVAWVNWAKQNGHLPSDYPTSIPPPKGNEKQSE